MSLPIFVALAAFVALAVAQDLTVNTPSSAQACLPVAISWTGGVPPVYVSLIPGGQAGGAIVQDFGPQNGNSYTWNVNQPAGTSLTVQIRDSTGKINYSDKFTVQPSTQTCKAGDTPAAAPGKAGTPASPATPTTPGSSSNSTKPATPGASTTPGTTPSSGTSTTGGSTASSNTAPTTGTTPAGQAGASDASRTIPGFFGLALAGALAIFV